MTTVIEIEGKLSTHEAVCVEHYITINSRLQRLEGILLAAAGAIIARSPLGPSGHPCALA